jgi:hypothetical protein
MRTPGPLVAVLLLALAHSANSAFTIGTIDVDFNGSVATTASAVDAGVIGSTGDSWNTIVGAPSGSQALNLTDGSLSGVSLQLSGTFITGLLGGANGPNTNLTEDFLAVGGPLSGVNTGTITLSGLTANQQYAVYLYNGSLEVGRITDFSISGTGPAVTGSATNIGAPGAAVWNDATQVAGNYVLLNATASNTGQLVVQFMNRAASEGDLAGFQIRAIPEPSTNALFITGVAGLLVVGYRARRRRGVLRSRYA